MHMIEMTLDLAALVGHAHGQGNNHTRDEDLGYAIHGWFADALGELSPKPFRVMGRRGSAVRVLGYAGAPVEHMRARVSQFATPLAARAPVWDASGSKDMSGITWQAGQTLGFELRACPTVRVHKGGEKDAFLAEVEKGMDPGRLDSYRRWLIRQLGEAASLDQGAFSLDAFQLTSVWRKGAGDSGARKGRGLTVPDATMSGRITVSDADAFSALMRRGVGRHRAFGFGMLLLRPA